jgi:hypothetical protein
MSTGTPSRAAAVAVAAAAAHTHSGSVVCVAVLLWRVRKAEREKGGKGQAATLYNTVCMYRTHASAAVFLLQSARSE